MFFALNQTLRWKILLLYYQWTESVQPGVLKRLFSANFQLSYFLWWTFFAALHNSKLKLILMYLIMAPLSPICFSHSDLFSHLRGHFQPRTGDFACFCDYFVSRCLFVAFCIASKSFFWLSGKKHSGAPCSSPGESCVLTAEAWL